jgi:predicted transcriptional regulator
MKDSFLPTFTLFTEILKKSIGFEKDEDEKYSLKFLEYVVGILDIIEQNVVVTKEEIMRTLRLPEYIFNNFIEYLKKMEFLDVSALNNKSVVSLTKSGKNYFDEIVGKFSIDAIKNFKNKIGKPKIEEIPPFLGFLIADRNGRTLMSTEVYDGAFNLFLQFGNDIEKRNELDLIPMFISALEKFAEEINIRDLPGFKLEGSNLKIHTVKYEICTFCLFMRTDVNFETVKEYTLVWFDDLMEVHKSKIEMSIETGNMVYSQSLKEDTKNWLDKLTQKYNDMVINIEIYDFEQVKKLYQQLDDLYSKIDFKYSMTLKKLKKLKIDLMEASSDNNFLKIREIVKKIKELEI